MRTSNALIVAIASVALIGWLGRTGTATRGVASTQELALDRTTWTVTVVPDPAVTKEGQQGFTDTLKFRRNKMTRAMGRRDGFRASEYAVAPSYRGMSFTTQQLNKRLEVTVWTGEIIDGEMRGQMVWTAKDGSQRYYRFHGRQVY